MLNSERCFFIAIFDDDVLAGVWDLSPPERGWDEVAQDVMEQRGW